MGHGKHSPHITVKGNYSKKFAVNSVTTGRDYIRLLIFISEKQLLNMLKVKRDIRFKNRSPLFCQI